MKIASVQLDSQWHDKATNLVKARSYAERAAKDGCELIVFPEMFNTGFSMCSEVTLEPQNGQTSQYLKELAVEYGIGVIAGLCEEFEGIGQNVALFITSNGQVTARYVKNYPFTFAGEDESYSGGNEQVVFDLGEYRSSIFICYDLRFPELFRKVAKSIDIIFVIASWPKARQHHWEVLLQARAIENQCFVVGVNRTGKDGNGLEYGGGSHVFSPSGEDLSHGGDSDDYIFTDVNLSESQSLRKLFPYLKDIKAPL